MLSPIHRNCLIPQNEEVGCVSQMSGLCLGLHECCQDGSKSSALIEILAQAASVGLVPLL